MRRIAYENLPIQPLEPESDLEEDVLRAALLPDGFTSTPHSAADLSPCQRHLLVAGGQLVESDAWCPGTSVLYQLGERRGPFFELLVTFLDRRDAGAVGSLELTAVPDIHPPPVQAQGEGPPRRATMYPVWHFAPERARPEGIRLLSEPGVEPGPWHWLAVADRGGWEFFEWKPAVPHLLLVDPGSIGGS